MRTEDIRKLMREVEEINEAERKLIETARRDARRDRFHDIYMREYLEERYRKGDAYVPRRQYTWC